MAKQQSQWKAPQLDPHQQEALVKLGQHMGHGMDQFDIETGNEIERLVHEGNYKKMKAAMRGGDLGPEKFEQEQAQQTGAMQQLAASAGQQQAAQAQGAETSVAPQAAPSGPAGVSVPYEAQKAPGALPTTGKAPQQSQSQGPPPAAPGPGPEA